MKTTMNISLKNQCSENFNAFAKTDHGRYCNHCQQEVVDFTSMGEMELISYFSTTKEPICGRFTGRQLTTYKSISPMMQKNLLTRLIGTLGISLLALCHAPKSNAQSPMVLAVAEHRGQMDQRPTLSVRLPMTEYIIVGQVLDPDNLPLPGANVILKGTSTGTMTDFEGRFEFPIPLRAGDVLLFSYLGYGTKEYKVRVTETVEQEVNIQFSNADVELMGAVEIEGTYSSKTSVFQKFLSLFKKG